MGHYLMPNFRYPDNKNSFLLMEKHQLKKQRHDTIAESLEFYPNLSWKNSQNKFAALKKVPYLY